MRGRGVVDRSRSNITKFEPRHNDRTMIDEEEQMPRQRRPTQAPSSIGDLCANIPAPLAGQMEYPGGPQGRGMIVQGQVMPFPGMRSPFFMQGQQLMTGAPQFFIMQPVTDLHGMNPQFYNTNQSNSRHTGRKK